MNIINLTADPVPIAIHSSIGMADKDGEIQCSIVYKPSGKVATPHWSDEDSRLLEVGQLGNDFVYIGDRYEVAIENLPSNPQEGVIYIVDPEVAKIVPEREDVFFPDPENILYDNDGNIFAHRGILRYHDKWMKKANHWKQQCGIVHENLMHVHAILDDPEKRAKYIDEIDQINQENQDENNRDNLQSDTN